MTTWVSFTTRYGLHAHGWDRDPVASRHGPVEDDSLHVHFRETGQCEADPRRTCQCPGGIGNACGRHQCCQTMTAEDLLCDACRDHCVAIDSKGNYHRFINLYGSRAS